MIEYFKKSRTVLTCVDMFSYVFSFCNLAQQIAKDVWMSLQQLSGCLDNKGSTIATVVLKDERFQYSWAC